jgi:hypothetical protein
MKLRTTPDGPIAYDPDRDRWLRLPDERDLLGFLAGGQPAVDRALTALAADHAEWALLRPDRFVFACGGQNELPQALAALRATVADGLRSDTREEVPA